MTIRKLIEFEPTDMVLSVICRDCGSEVVINNENVRQCGQGHAFEKACMEALSSYLDFLYTIPKCDSKFRFELREAGES